MRSLLLIVLLVSSGCTQMLAEQIVRAPNKSEDVPRGIDASADELQKLYVDRQLRIPVGPPDATISVWVFDPFSGPETIHFVGTGRQVQAELQRTGAMHAITPKGTIFVLHGIQDYKELAPYVLYREQLVHQGYRVVQLDLRGHGRSTGEWITYGAVESRDLKQVLDALESEYLIAGNVGVIGISYGAAVAIQWAAIDPRVRAIVAIEPYSSFRQVAYDGASFVLGPSRLIFSDDDIRECENDAGLFGNFNPDDVDVVRSIQKTSAPVLLIHSKSDEFIPWEHSQRLHDAAKDHSKLILVDGNSHFDIWLKSFDLINRESLGWFEKNLQKNEQN
jgi:pimeloyl-ACP methyl ester carboxylesterase